MRYTNIEPLSLRDAKYYLALCKPSPDAELLDEVVRRFPEHAGELTEFAIDLALDSAAESEDQRVEPSNETSPAVSKAISRFQNRLYAEKNAAASPRPNPFASMKREELRAFAKNINANLPFVMKLRDRQIQPETITEGFRRRVGEELNVPIELLTAHFAELPGMHTGARFKSDKSPEVGARQSFEEAVRTSALSPEQREFLLKL